MSGRDERPEIRSPAGPRLPTLGTVDIRVLDPTDEALVRRHWDIGRAADLAHRPYDLYWPWESAWATHSEGRTDMRSVLLGAFEGDTMWGAGQVDFPVHDNPHLTFAEFFVHPDRQRRGIGRALVEAGWQQMCAAGRRTMTVEVFAPPEQPSAGLRCAQALGFTEAITDVMKVVDLKGTEASWVGLATDAARHHAGYQLLTWHDLVPPELVPGYCVLNEAFVDEAPMGDLDVEAERWDPQRVREQEARNARSGRHVVATFALDADGTVVGATEVMVNENVRWRGMQSGTLVLPGHRGHRLGLAMKLANHAAVRERWPEVEVLFTGNAGVNAPMNAVNERLGYADFERCVEVQRSL